MTPHTSLDTLGEGGHRLPPTINPKTNNAGIIEAIEKSFYEEYGLSLEDQSDLNVEWMRKHGFEAVMRTTSERARTKMLREKREARSRLLG